MNWKPGDMAVAIYNSKPGISNDLPSGTVVIVTGTSDTLWSYFTRAATGREVYSVTTMYQDDLYDCIETVLHPITDPDQQAEPRETEINRPCEA